jgi:cell division protein FtsZ
MGLIEFEKENEYTACIKVVGVGGGGTNAVNSMLKANLQGVDFVIANTDVQSLEASACPQKVKLGEDLTKGLGAGSSPEVGRMAAEESKGHIRENLEGADMVFITSGMGGGTGTGGAPVVANIAREMGALTVGVVTLPFMFEGKKRLRQAEAGIEELNDAVDTLIVIPNQKLLSFIAKHTALTGAFEQVDDVLKQAVCSISDLIVIPGLINLDFADVKTVMSGMGKALMGSGTAEGENRAIEAAEKAISSPLLEDATIDGAQGILINITGGPGLTLHDVNEAAMLVHQSAHEDANIIFGAVIDKNMEEEMRVTVIATGCQNNQEEVRVEPVEREMVVPLRKVVNSSVPQPDRHNEELSYDEPSLKNLANTIKQETGESFSSSANFDIPTFLRKHAD